MEIRARSLVDEKPDSILHNKQNDLDLESIVQTDDEEDLMYETQNEEYLDQVEEDSIDYDNGTLMDTDEVHYELHLRKDHKEFECQLCDRKFASRSGRDTHNQLKHKAPTLESTSLDEHEIETGLEDGTATKAWKCPICQLVSKKKNHHQTHMIRHAIREKEDAVKQGIQQNEHSTGARSLESVEATTSKTEIKRVLSRVPINHTSHVVTIDDHFSCSRCKSKFAEVEDAKSHVQKYARTGMCTDALCKDCSVVFSSQKLYKRHVEFHAVSPIVASLGFSVCLNCQIVFGNPSDLEVHLSTNHLCETDRTNQLDGAEFVFFDLQPDLSSEDYRCAYCVKTGPKDDVNLHMALFHGSLVCPFDKQEFARYSGYFMEHMKSKHPELFGDVDLNFKCPHCELNFPSKAAKTEHCLKCDAKSFHCTHCDKRFAFERQLKKHMAVVNGIKTHKCDFCEKSFVSRSELNVHMRTHTNERSYFCSFPGCKKSFRTNSHRSAHMDIHNPDKNFKCSECEEIFQTRTLRRLHEKLHVTGSIGCELCQKEFGQRSHYVRHIKRVHHIQCNSLNLEETIRQLNNKDEVV